jgi:WD40 repeat protein
MIARLVLVLLAGCLVVPGLGGQAPPKPATDGLGDTLPDGAVARLGTLRLKHAFADAAVFSPDGMRFVSLGPNSATLRLWDTITGKEIPGSWSSTNRPGAAAFSPDGTVVAVAPSQVAGNNTSQSQVILYDIARGKALRALPGKWPDVRALLFTDGGKTLVLAGAGTVSWWDSETGKEQRSWKPLDEKQPAAGGVMKTKTFDVCALAPDARSIAVRVAWNNDPAAFANREANDHEALGLDLANGKTLWRVAGRYTFQHHSHFAFSADGQRVAISMGPNRVEVRSAVTGKLVATPLERMFDGTYTRGPVALSGDGRTVAVAGEGSSVLLWTPTPPRSRVASCPGMRPTRPSASNFPQMTRRFC